MVIGLAEVVPKSASRSLVLAKHVRFSLIGDIVANKCHQLLPSSVASSTRQAHA